MAQASGRLSSEVRSLRLALELPTGPSAGLPHRSGRYSADDLPSARRRTQQAPGVRILTCPCCSSLVTHLRDHRLLIAHRSAGGRFEINTTITLTESFTDGLRIERMLGHGAMAAVYLAKARHQASRVAVKFLTRLDEEDVVRRFLREVKMLTGIRHPNVLEVTDVGVLQRHPYIVCEYVEGGTLRERLATGGALPFRDGVALILDVLAGLQACHDHGIVHRDLKPENILLTPDHRAKVADLGLAKYQSETDGATMIGTLVGTPRYMSPEQAFGTQASLRSDLYSMGAILYEVFTGKRLFAGTSVPELLRQHIDPVRPDIRALAPELPPALGAIIQQALARDPADRPASAREMARVIEEATALGPATPRSRTPAPSRRSTVAVPAPAVSSTVRRPAAAPASRRARIALAVVTVMAAIVLVQGLRGSTMRIGDAARAMVRMQQLIDGR